MFLTKSRLELAMMGILCSMLAIGCSRKQSIEPMLADAQKNTTLKPGTTPKVNQNPQPAIEKNTSIEHTTRFGEKQPHTVVLPVEIMPVQKPVSTDEMVVIKDPENCEEAPKKENPIKELDANQKEQKAKFEEECRNGWTWEDILNSKRQRPVKLIIISSAGLKNPHKVGLKYAEAIAHLKWDVKIVLHKTGNPEEDFRVFSEVSAEIDRINKAIKERKKPADPTNEIATFKTIDKPMLYQTNEELENLVNTWLEKNFGEIPIGHAKLVGGGIAPKKNDLVDPKVNEKAATMRPPFGGISILGHGESSGKLENRPNQPFGTPAKLIIQSILPDGVKSETRFSLSSLEKKILQTYQAPIFCLTDMCRQNGVPVVDEKDKKDGMNLKLTRREFTNLDKFAKDKNTIEEVEKLREKVSYGDLRPSISKLTIWHTAGNVTTIPDEEANFLHHHLTTMLTREKNSIGFTNYDKKKEILLFEANSWILKRFEKEKVLVFGKPQTPKLYIGSVPDSFVVYSADPGNAYKPIYPNLLYTGLTPKLILGELDVPEFGKDKDPHYGSLTTTRTKKVPDDECRAVFKFTEELKLHVGQDYELIGIFSAKATTPTNQVKFAFGAYSKEAALTSKFQFYGDSETHKGLLTDGYQYLFNIPLDRVDRTKPTAIERFEVQVSPNEKKKNWLEGISMKIHGVYLVPAGTKKEDLNAELDRSKAAARLNEMIHWDTPLHHQSAKSIGIETTTKMIPPPKPKEKEPAPKPKDTRVTTTTLNQLDKTNDKPWGASGSVYPKLAVTKGTSFFIKLPEGNMINGNTKGKISIVIYGHDKILATYNQELKNLIVKKDGEPITIQEDGVLQDIAILIEGFQQPVKIEFLESK